MRCRNDYQPELDARGANAPSTRRSLTWHGPMTRDDTPVSVSTANPLVAVAAVNWLVGAGQEGHHRVRATLGADRWMHLALGAIRPIATARDSIAAAATPVLAPQRAAARAASWLVHEPPAGVELLLARGKHELVPTVSALEDLVAKAHGDLPTIVRWQAGCWSCAMARTANAPPGLITAPR